jgi:hypothetical protein
MLETIWTHPSRCIPALIGLAATLSCGSEDGPTAPPPPRISLQVAPPHLSILRGTSASVGVNATRSDGVTGSVYLTVSGAPAGVIATVINSQTSGPVTTATITIEVNAATRPGTYALEVRGAGSGIVSGTAEVSLTIYEVLPPCPQTGVCEQWATGAAASSEYFFGGWNAYEAAGPPDVIGCSDDPHAWASNDPHTVEWLELTYASVVRPTEIRVYENWGVSSIVKVEVGDGSGAYHTVYTAEAERQSCPRILAIPVTGIATAMKVVRVTVDQRTLRDWNEIDAVKLIGTR